MALTRIAGVTMKGGEAGAAVATCVVDATTESGTTLNLYSGNDWVRATRLKQTIQRAVDAAQPGGVAEVDLAKL